MPDKRWIGAADDVKQVSTITVGGTWATSETAIVEINNKQLIVTIGTSVATTDVAAELSASINASTATTPAPAAGYSRNKGGQEIPEFTEIVASVSGSVVTIESASGGVPFTFTSDDSGSTSGTLTDATTTNATGKNHFNNADNWEGAVAPVTSDTIIFDNGAISVLYNLNNSVADLQMVRTNSYTGNIGLPQTSTVGYVEYRQRFLDLPVQITSNLVHKIGDEDGGGAATGRTYVDFGTVAADDIEVYIFDSQAAGSDGAAVQIEGGDNLSLYAYAGSVGVGRLDATDVPTLKNVVIGRTGAAAASVDVTLDRQCAHTNNASDIFQVHAGTLEVKVDIDGALRTIQIYGGTVTTAPNNTFNFVDIFGGTLKARHATTATCQVFAGILDLSEMESAHTFTNNVELYHGFTVIDPAASYLGEFDFNGCNVNDGTLTLRDNLRATMASL